MSEYFAHSLSVFLFVSAVCLSPSALKIYSFCCELNKMTKAFICSTPGSYSSYCMKGLFGQQLCIDFFLLHNKTKLIKKLLAVDIALEKWRHVSKYYANNK